MKFPWKDLPLIKYKTSDNANLFFYRRKAKNKSKGTLLFLCGWSQGPNNWSPCLLTNEYVKEHYNVYVLVMRGYKNIEDNFSNNISRYAKDVVEFIHSKKLNKITAVGHSMGSSIFWNVLSLYGEKFFDSYVFIDQPLQVLKNPDKFINELNDMGSIFSSNDLFSFYNSSAESSSKSAENRGSFEQKCFSPEFIAKYPNIYIKCLAGVYGYNYKVANEILFDHVLNNYDQIFKSFPNKLQNPVLLIGGKASIVPYQTLDYQKQYYITPTVKIFEIDEGGSHSMYLENYELFNNTLNDFLKKNEGVLQKIKINIDNGISKTKKLFEEII